MLAGPSGLVPNQELTYFYPSTEWSMAQPFTCFCGTPACKGLIDGAGKMPREKLEGVWLNGWIRDLLNKVNGHRNGHFTNGNHESSRGRIGVMVPADSGKVSWSCCIYDHAIENKLLPYG